MLDIDRDVDSHSNFQRNTPEFVRHLKESGLPVTLTIDGKAELVVQDATSYQKLRELADRETQREITRRSLAEMLAEMGRMRIETHSR